MCVCVEGGAREKEEKEKLSGSEEGCFALVCLDRKKGSLTSDPGPLCGCERVCVFILLACGSEQVLSDAGWMHRWSLLSWQSVQVRMSGVSCPKVHESSGVVMFCIRIANGQQSTTAPKR